MTRLVFEPLNEATSALLIPHIRMADRVEIAISGLSPEYALRHGMMAGRAWAIIKEQPGDDPEGFRWPVVLGAGGFTYQGAIWSYWRDLIRAEARAVLKETPDWLRGIRALAGDRTLANYVWDGNHEARQWLRLSECFDIREHEPLDVDGKRCIPFYLKSSEELARV